MTIANHFTNLVTLLLLLGMLSYPPIFGQKIQYTIRGKLVDDNGQPAPSLDVYIFPIIERFSFELLIEPILTNGDGEFTATEQTVPGDRAYLYTSSTIPGSRNEYAPLRPPFVQYNGVDKRFLGLPVEFGNQPLIDLGPVKIGFWYGDANLKFLSNGKPLSRAAWEKVWLRLIDDRGRC
ncbi:MAG TPA: hypothetical protein VMZ26_06295, partial [Pyrinomonadaceae bacterium]|nr:hypothetical protein [Pyrinomonadaceae bacterium]